MTSPWRVTVLTLFPDMFPGPLGVSLAGKALSTGVWSLEARDIRDSATDRHRSVDDAPAGGGPGMVLRADVLAALGSRSPPVGVSVETHSVGCRERALHGGLTE